MLQLADGVIVENKAPEITNSRERVSGNQPEGASLRGLRHCGASGTHAASQPCWACPRPPALRGLWGEGLILWVLGVSALLSAEDPTRSM